MEMPFSQIKKRLQDAIEEGRRFSFPKVLRHSEYAAFKVWMGRITSLLANLAAKSELGKAPHNLAMDAQKDWPQTIPPGTEDMLEDDFQQTIADMITAAEKGIRVIEDEYGDQLDEPPKSTRAAVPTERPRSTTSDYNLTESQKEILRKIVAQVEPHGNVNGDEIWITWTSGGTRIQDYEGAPPEITPTVLDLFAENKLMVCQRRSGPTLFYRCALT